MRAERRWQTTVVRRISRHALPAAVLVLAVGCSAEPAPVEELRRAVVNTLPPDPPNFQSELLPGAPRALDAAANPARGGQYPIGRARNPVPPGYRAAPATSPPVQVPQGLPAELATTTTIAAETTTTTTAPEGPTTTSSAPASDASADGAREAPSTTTTTSPVLGSGGIDP